MVYIRPPPGKMRKNRATQRRDRYFMTLLACVGVLIVGLTLRGYYKGFFDSIIYADPLVAKYRHLPNEMEQAAMIKEKQKFDDSQLEKDQAFKNDPMQLEPEPEEANEAEEEKESVESKSAPSLGELKLLSLNAKVKASVRGNLQDASVVTTDPALVSVDHEATLSKEEYNRHWLTQRWQAASNMGGKPIQGLHWLIMDLGEENSRSNTIYRQIIDFEDAYSVDYSIYYNTHSDGDLKEDNWNLCVDTKPEPIPRGKRKEKFQSPYKYVKNTFRVDLDITKRKHHIVHTIDHKENSEYSIEMPENVRYLKLVIHAPGTRFGTSIWRWQVWGTTI